MGTAAVPGDKSISHRALILGAIAEGPSRITNLSTGEDVRSTRRCLEGLGVEFRMEGDTMVVSGAGIRGLHAPDEALDAGNSGTTVRLLSGILAGSSFDTILTGDESLRHRPMQRIIDPLSLMGADIRAEGGKAPLNIRGRELHPIDYASSVASAQVKSCVILAGLSARGRTTLTEPSLSRDHTERMLPCFGVEPIREGCRVSIDGPVRLKGTHIHVPGDLSSAAFFIAAAAMLEGSELRLAGVGVNPTRTGLLDVLRGMGADISLDRERLESGEPRADLLIRGGRLKPVTLYGSMIPRLIDEIPILAVMATRAEGETIIKDAQELRVKETDRIRAVVRNLRAMGGHAIETKDGLIVPGSQSLSGGIVESYGDHRIAMAFSVAGLTAAGETTIQDVSCIDTSFPGFFELLQEISDGGSGS